MRGRRPSSRSWSEWQEHSFSCHADDWLPRFSAAGFLRGELRVRASLLRIRPASKASADAALTHAAEGPHGRRAYGGLESLDRTLRASTAPEPTWLTKRLKTRSAIRRSCNSSGSPTTRSAAATTWFLQSSKGIIPPG